MRENTDQNNSEYGHFLHSDDLLSFLFDCNVKGMELTGQVIGNNYQLTLIFWRQFFYLSIILTFEGIHYD